MVLRLFVQWPVDLMSLNTLRREALGNHRENAALRQKVEEAIKNAMTRMEAAATGLGANPP